MKYILLLALLGLLLMTVTTDSFAVNVNLDASTLGDDIVAESVCLSVMIPAVNDTRSSILKQTMQTLLAANTPCNVFVALTPTIAIFTNELK